MTVSTIEILNRGMKCLTEKLGTIDAEQFIAAVIRERFDYTKWQREFFDAKTPEEISQEAKTYAEKNPYFGTAAKL